MASLTAWIGHVSMTLVLLVLLALAFDFMNGFHDAANSIATVVSTGVLKPWQAVIWAAFFNVLAVGVFTCRVAATVGKGIIDPAFVDNRLIFGALIGAISLEPHHLVLRHSVELLARAHRRHDRRRARQGRHRAAARARHHQDRLVHLRLAVARHGLRRALMLIVSWLFFRQTPRRVDKWFRRLQLVSSAAYSMGHGGNDAQKTMGIIWLLLIANGVTTKDHLPTGW